MKIAFTGSHGTGKTTSLYKLLYETKINNPNNSVHGIYEIAATSPFKINLESTESSQLYIFSKQLEAEIFYTNKFDIVICDRTIMDCIAYSEYFGFKEFVNSIMPFCEHYIKTYDEIYFKKCENNNYCHNDKIRIGDNDSYRIGVENCLLNLYEKMNYTKHLKFL